MKTIQNVTLDEERALYGSQDIAVKNVRFDGPADGESALKECRNVVVENCYCNLRYPFWHDTVLKISDTELTPLCRAALWYSRDVQILRSKLHGIKALRECANVVMEDCDVASPEFGWSASHLTMNNTTVTSEYFVMRAENITMHNVTLHGKYSFQYVQNATLTQCNLDTKDAFWHTKNVHVKDSVVKGEYLAWYSDGLTLENCTIIGTQPFCYCTNLKLINCKMLDTDLCFERSQVQAEVTTHVVSIKNVYEGTVTVPSVGEIIRDDENARGKVVVLG